MLFFNRNVMKKQIVINLLVTASFIVILLAFLYSFNKTDTVLSELVQEQASCIMENARIAKYLARIVSNTNLMTSRFMGNDELLETDSASVLNMANALSRDSRNRELNEALSGFTKNIEEIIALCREINGIQKSLAEEGEDFEETLKAVSDFIGDKILTRAMEGKDVSTDEQLSILVMGYNETYLKIRFMTANLGLEYFKVSLVEKEHPVLTLADDLALRLRSLNASYEEVAEYGSKLTSVAQNLRNLVVRYHQTAGDFQDKSASLKIREEQLLALVKKVTDDASDAVKSSMSSMKQTISSFMWIFLIAFFTAAPLVILSLFMAFHTGRSLRQIIKGLTEAFHKVDHTSTVLLSASNDLASGSSQQAAAIEETSSSLEEISAMIRRNAENAGRANILRKDGVSVIENAKNVIGELTRSMNDISRSGEETRKIVKTIDEIAFQTNLLALNAAVEAARAGETGAGFAVVASEVRNLAGKAAESAKNTADLIEVMIRKVCEGVGYVNQASDAFSNVSGTSGQIGTIVAEIAAASSEQSEGIVQITKAVADMDQIVQKNAAGAEESASVSEEMAGQAALLKNYISRMLQLTGGEGQAETNREGRKKESPDEFSRLTNKSAEKFFPPPDDDLF